MQKITFLCLFFTLILIGSCKKDKPDDPDPEPVATLNPAKPDVTIYEIAMLEAKNMVLSQKEYDAVIGGLNVKAYAAPGSANMGFFVPDLPEGKHEFSVTIDGKDYKADFNVKSAIQVADPDAFISTSLNEFTFTDSELDDIHTRMKDMEGNESSEKNIATIKAFTRFVRESIANLSEDEKKQLASFMAANPDLFAPSNDPSAYIDSFSFNKNGTCPEDALNEIFERTEKEWKKLVLIGVITGVSVASGMPILGACVGLAGIIKIYNLNMDNIASLSKALVRFGDINAEDVSMQKKGSVYAFYNDKSYVIKIKSAYRKPNNLDVNSGIKIIDGIVLVLDGVGHVWKEVNLFTSKFGYTLEGNPYHIKNVKDTRSKTYHVDPKFISVGNISNPKVTGELEVTAEGVQVKFNTTEVQRQEFSFDIKYKSPAGQSTLKFEGTIEPVLYYVLDEEYKLLVDPTVFRTGKEKVFYLSLDKKTANYTADYQKITIAGNTNPNISIKLDINSTYFIITLNHTQPSGETTQFGIHYDGKLIQTVSASIPDVAVGDRFQGGIVAHIFRPVGDVGYVPGEIHGLIVSPADQSDGAQWGCRGYQVFVDPVEKEESFKCGRGLQNTIAIMNKCSTAGIAAQICYDLVLNGYDDWYLPTWGDFDKLLVNKHKIGYFSPTYYWTSNEEGTVGWAADFEFNYMDKFKKDEKWHVRAARSF